VDDYERLTHPFVVKLWLEERALEGGCATWRGYIIHVPSGAVRYFQDLEEILRFVRVYLAQTEKDTGR
jgi:hypothetical protein